MATFCGFLKIYELNHGRYELNIKDYFHSKFNIERKNASFDQGVVHKLHLQDEVGRWSKNVFVNVYTIEKVKGGGQKSQNLVNVACERPPRVHATLVISNVVYLFFW